MVLAAECEHVLEMGAQRVEIRSPAEERRIEVQADRAAGLRQRAQLIVRQVPRAVAQNAAIGMTGQNGGLRAVHELPERSFGQMTHIDPQTEPLRLPDKVAPTRRQAMRGAVPARKRVVGIPRQREHAEALFPQPFESARFAADDLAALHGQQRGDPPLLRQAQGLRTVCGKADAAAVLLHLAAQEGQRLRQQALRPAARPAGVAAERKDLGIGLQSGRFLQVDVAGIPFQPLPARPELIGGVAVSVKQLHENASSRCRISGRFVSVPKGA